MDDTTPNDQTTIVDSGSLTLQPPGEKRNAKTGPKPKELVETTIMGLCVGRDKKVVPPEEVYKLAAIGCKDSEIANWFGISYDTLRYNFAEELTKGREDVRIALRRAMLNNAVSNSNAALQIFLAKNWLGMSDNPTNTDDKKPLPWNEEED